MKPLWAPSSQRIATSNMAAFINVLNAKGHNLSTTNYDHIHQWSIEHPEQFWHSIWNFCDVIGEHHEKDPVLINKDQMPGAVFFPKARLNFAENLLRRRDTEPALFFWGENQVRRSLTYKELYDLTSELVQMMQEMGLKAGDRIAAFTANTPETVAAMLATSALGCIWSSCSPDFGVKGVIDRFGQIQPKLLFCTDGYFYNGKSFNSLDKVQEFIKELPTVEKVIVLPYLENSPLPKLNKPIRTLKEITTTYKPGTISFAKLPFNHPLYIMFTSGTTGVPKCIIHGAGGTLLQHLKEHQLHCDIKKNDRMFYFTTCSWMMWNWLISGLASNASLMLYDGSPFYLDGKILFDYAEQEQCTFFGTSAKFIDACHKAHLNPIETHNLSNLKTITSTGSPLSPDGFEYVYTHIKKDVLLSSISGGTDIISCFVLGNPTNAVWPGQIQAKGLGMSVEIWNDQGQPVVEKKGELVCTKPFPSMPLGFWNDPLAQRYHDAYFKKFPNIWYHGDYAEITKEGGIIIHGRSDAVLNPGGVRIGTAEIYREVEQLEEIEESLVIGQDWQNDVRVILFLKLRQGLTLDEKLENKIKQQIKTNTTPRHVPAKIIQIQDIPKTKNGKIVELAVRDVIAGLPIKNKEALANPDALDFYRNLAQLQS
ncbi:MAG: acetoacetate--CoA ligase [Alphaproteobacteria bacterium]|nr:acetoacetate--CoA ligase [Alphaproteobacteria bacterium]